MLKATILLPPRPRMLALGDSSFALWLARGDELTPQAPGRSAAIARVLRRRTPDLPQAAWSRQADLGDAGDDVWWRADPCRMRADPNGLRLVRFGGFELTDAHLRAIERTLKPLCGDLGFEFSAPSAERFYLRSMRDAIVVELPRPDDIVGDDVYAHLPAGAEGRLFRRLINDVQIELHQLSVLDEVPDADGQRLNSLWFWGGGRLGVAAKPAFATIASDDLSLRGMARQFELNCISRSSVQEITNGDLLVECWQPEAQRWFAEGLWPRLATACTKGRADLTLDFADGSAVRIAPGHRWRFWRRPRRTAATGA